MRRAGSKLIISLIALSLILDITKASAQEIYLTEAFLKDTYEECDAWLKGPILEGATDRLNQLDLEVKWSPSREAPTLCLDSPGGSLNEAVKLQRYLIEKNVFTYVDEASECLSACALVFLGGSARFGNGIGVHIFSRRMHPKSTLGFHAPEIQIPEGTFSQRQVKSAFSAGTEALLSFNLMTSRKIRGFKVMENSLLWATLLTQSGDMLYIDNVFKAYSSSIQLGEINGGINDILAPKGELAGEYACDNYVNKFFFTEQLLDEGRFQGTYLGQTDNREPDFSRLKSGLISSHDLYERFFLSKDDKIDFFGPYAPDQGVFIYYCGASFVSNRNSWAASIFVSERRFGTTDAVLVQKGWLRPWVALPMDYPIRLLDTH